MLAIRCYCHNVSLRTDSHSNWKYNMCTCVYWKCIGVVWCTCCHWFMYLYNTQGCMPIALAIWICGESKVSPHVKIFTHLNLTWKKFVFLILWLEIMWLAIGYILFTLQCSISVNFNTNVATDLMDNYNGINSFDASILLYYKRHN